MDPQVLGATIQNFKKSVHPYTLYMKMLTEYPNNFLTIM